MPAPSIVAVSPNPNSTDIVLGTTIVVTFDQLINTATITPATFSLTGPGQTQFISPTELNTRHPQSTTGREYVNGIFSFATNGGGNTVFTFTPDVPLRPNVIYTVLVVGAGNISSGAVVSNTEDPPVALNSTNSWIFTTGDLNTSTPPITSPLAPLTIPLDPSQIIIKQNIYAIGNDLSQQIDICFPAPIDKMSINPKQVLLSLEALLSDPSVVIPSSLQPQVKIYDNKISITIFGWPNN